MANLSATGTAIKWYSGSSGGSATTGSTALSDNTHYYASQTVSGCESTSRLDVTASVITNPAAPTGNASQSFCASGNPTVANLSATGSNIMWYATSSGGSALSTSTALTNGTYYASQTVNGCESTSRFNVTAVAISSTSSTTNMHVCSYIFWNGVVHTTTVSTYTTTGLTNAAGCDSSATLITSVIPQTLLLT